MNKKINPLFTEFVKLVQKSNSFDESFDDARKIKNISSEIGQLFFDTYNDKNAGGMKNAWKRFYDEVKSKKSVNESSRFSTLNKVQHLLKNDVVTVYYFGPHDTPETALKFDAKIVISPYISRNDVQAVVKSIDSTGEKYLDDGLVLYKRGRWVHAGKWNARKINKKILQENTMITKINEWMSLNEMSDNKIQLKFNLNTPYKWGKGWTGDEDQNEWMNGIAEGICATLRLESLTNDWDVIEGNGTKIIKHAYMHPMEYVFTLTENDSDTIQKIIETVNFHIEDVNFISIDSIKLKTSEGYTTL